MYKNNTLYRQYLTSNQLLINECLLINKLIGIRLNKDL
jgi:hypothetical protein